MSDIDFEFSAELVDIGLMAIADPQFAERMLTALDGPPEADRPTQVPTAGQAAGSDLGAAA